MWNKPEPACLNVVHSFINKPCITCCACSVLSLTCCDYCQLSANQCRVDFILLMQVLGMNSAYTCVSGMFPQGVHPQHILSLSKYHRMFSFLSSKMWKIACYFLCNAVSNYNQTWGQFNFRIGIDGQFLFQNWNCLFKKMELINLELKFATKN